jgi:hypothetical protein
MSAQITLFGPDSLAAVHEAEMPQKDQLCGAFWGCVALRAFGIRERAGEPVDQDHVAREARSTLVGPGHDPGLPPSEASRLDYRLELPIAPDAATSGTASGAVARAVRTLSDGRLAVVPVAGPWTAESVVTLLERVAAAAPDAVLVANLRTGRLWGSRPSPALVLGQLAGAAADGPEPDWDEGHFVSLSMLIRSAGGSLVGVRDTYPSLGHQGNHLQPPVAVAAALRRDDGHGGGVLCLCASEREAAVVEALGDAGFALEDWDNGSADAA